MTDTDIGAGTSPRRRRAKLLSPAQFIAKLRKDDPAADAATIRQRYESYCRERILFDDDQVEALVMPYVIEALQRNVKDRPSLAEREARRAEQAALRAATVEALKRAHEEFVEAEVGIRLLEYQTTYGKALGDCTGAECARLSRRYGSFYGELSKRLTRGETVRSHLTEAELQAIARTHRLIGEKAPR